MTTPNPELTPEEAQEILNLLPTPCLSLADETMAKLRNLANPYGLSSVEQEQMAKEEANLPPDEQARLIYGRLGNQGP